MDIIASVRRYEKWMEKCLGRELDREDLKDKHKKMAQGTFQFLRGTYWRWAETIYDDKVCPELRSSPEVLAVGDIHVENFGTWRDAEGRLVWGVNDFDEAARMPYVIDIVRLATSAELAPVENISLETICASVLKGYREGMEAAEPRPFVLDRENEEMRKDFVVSEDERKAFWEKFDPAKIEAAAIEEGKRPKVRPADPPADHKKVLKHARPDSSVHLRYFARTAGTGSLGRPRFVGIGEWRGDLIVRESKAMLPSGWVLAHGGSKRLRPQEIAEGRHRSPDPTYRLRGDVLVRRLSPNDFKIEAKDPEEKAKKGKKARTELPEEEPDNHRAVTAATLVNKAVLEAMGRDLAAIHRGTHHRRKEIVDDLTARPEGWLQTAVKAARTKVEADQKAWALDFATRKAEKKSKKAKRKPKKRNPDR
jgi:hypothetical protein